MTRACISFAALSLLAGALTGCGGSPPARFYVLSVAPSVAAEGTEKASADYSVTVGPVSLPDAVDRPQLVVRVGANQVALLEEHRWAEPLQGEIARVIAGNLSQLLGARQVVAYSPQTTGDEEYRVTVDIQRFDSVVGQSAQIDAVWTVRGAGGTAHKTGRTVARESTGESSYDALVAAHSRALATVSAQIGEAIHSMNSTGAKTPLPAAAAPTVAP
ncbi:MAG: PqiC family protein [Nitrospiraceae bacterium]